MSDRLLLRPAEAAELLSISRAKLYQLLAKPNTLPCIRVGASLRIPRQALEAWVESQLQAGTL